MYYLHITVVLLISLHILANSAATDTISVGQALSTGDKLVSKNGRYALGFFDTGGNSSQNTSSWYLGIWFNSIPKFNQAWVANRDDPIKNPSSVVLKIFQDGNLVIFNQSSGSTIWSTRAKITRNNTVVVLGNTGNLMLRNTSNSSNILWQSFDYPTDSLFPGAKLGLDKVTGLNRRLVSRKNSMSPATGAYREEVDPSGLNQFVVTFVNSTVPYWSSGVWNGKYFPNVEEYSKSTSDPSRTFVDNAQEKYYTYEAPPDMMVHMFLDVSGQLKAYVWYEGSRDWILTYTQPRALCDVYVTCGPFTTCNDDILPQCSCMKGFTKRSPKDWELDDRTGGCVRNTPLDCITNGNLTSSSDKFYRISCVSLSQSFQMDTIETAQGTSECSQVCLNNCTCIAYSFSNNTCFLWHGELFNIRQQQCSSRTTSNAETLYLRLAAKDVQSVEEDRRRNIAIGVAIGTSVASLGLFVLILLIMILRNKRKRFGLIAKTAQGHIGVIAFLYSDLQRATKKFSEKIGEGGFGSVYKGFLNVSTAIAVKRLDRADQEEKQFRAEVSSIGVIQHVNLVKLIGFCCEGARRLLVYEHMPNGSLDIHLFHSKTAVLKWSTRYQIALGVARGLSYLHENCRECIIHCDIKPENILLSDSFVPKIADFGMSKILGRDFSRVLTTMRGTIGYLAPEWISGVAITPKVDVYSYGMVLLELVFGRRNSCVSCSCGGNHEVYYPVHVAREILDGDVMRFLDHRLCGEVNLIEVEIACKVACWCIQDEEFDRPTMTEVLQMLEGRFGVNIPPMPRLLQAIAGSSHSTCS